MVISIERIFNWSTFQQVIYNANEKWEIDKKMPPKKTFSKEKIIDAAVAIVRRSGIESLNARAIAKQLGSSTMPVYSSIESMGKVKEEVVKCALNIAKSFRESFDDKTVLMRYALAHVILAKEEKKLFRLLHLNENKETLSIIDSMIEDIVKTFRELLAEEGIYDVSDEDRFEELLFRFWMTVRGISIEVNYDHFRRRKAEDYNLDFIEEYLNETFDLLLVGYKK